MLRIRVRDRNNGLVATPERISPANFTRAKLRLSSSLVLAPGHAQGIIGNGQKQEVVNGWVAGAENQNSKPARLLSPNKQYDRRPLAMVAISGSDIQAKEMSVAVGTPQPQSLWNAESGCTAVPYPVGMQTGALQDQHR